MLKREVVSEISERTGYTGVSVRAVLEMLEQVVLERVGRGEEMPLLRLGIFEVTRRRQRKARVVSTGEVVDVPARNVVKFRPFTLLRNAAGKAKRS